MGKKYSKQAWISREGPEGDCVVENDATNLTLDFTEEPKEKATCTADFTYKGYPVNVLQDGPCGSEKELCKKYSYYDYPIEVVELPDEPDGKRFELFFEREGQVEASTQTTRPMKAISECGQSIKSVGSDRQEWSYTLYDFEGQGQVTRDDLRNLVKSIYDVLGKSISRPKGTQKDPVKKLCVKLSLSKERGRDLKSRTRQECVLAASGFEEHPRRSKGRKYLSIPREGSLTVNPPSSDCLSQVGPQNSLCEPIQSVNHPSSGGHHRRSPSCRRCEHRQPVEKDCVRNDPRRSANPVDSKGMYHFPKRMQTGPGECHPPVSNSDEMTRVKEWIDQWCHMYDKGEEEVSEEHHRHKHKVHHRHRVCQTNSCDVACGLRRCPQYLDLATDHLTYPYHTESQSFPIANGSPTPQHHHRHSEHHHCKRSCARDNDLCHHDGQPVIHRHEHHHHHSHHHYHHYVS